MVQRSFLTSPSCIVTEGMQLHSTTGPLNWLCKMLHAHYSHTPCQMQKIRSTGYPRSSNTSEHHISRGLFLCTALPLLSKQNISTSEKKPSHHHAAEKRWPRFPALDRFAVVAFAAMTSVSCSSFCMRLCSRMKASISSRPSTARVLMRWGVSGLSMLCSSASSLLISVKVRGVPSTSPYRHLRMSAFRLSPSTSSASPMTFCRPLQTHICVWERST